MYLDSREGLVHPAARLPTSSMSDPEYLNGRTVGPEKYHFDVFKAGVGGALAGLVVAVLVNELDNLDLFVPNSSGTSPATLWLFASSMMALARVAIERLQLAFGLDSIRFRWVAHAISVALAVGYVTPVGMTTGAGWRFAVGAPILVATTYGASMVGPVIFAWPQPGLRNAGRWTMEDLPRLTVGSGFPLGVAIIWGCTVLVLGRAIYERSGPSGGLGLVNVLSVGILALALAWALLLSSRSH